MTDGPATANPFSGFVIDLCLGAASGIVSKTVTAPISRVQIILQTQDAHPRVTSGNAPRFTGAFNVFSRTYAEQGLRSFWFGNAANCLTFFPTQAFNLAFKDAIKSLLPKYDPKTQVAGSMAVNMASGGMAAFGSQLASYPLTFAHIRMAASVGPQGCDFAGIVECWRRCAAGPKGVRELYSGMGMALLGVPLHRGVSLGVFDTLTGLNPYKRDMGVLGMFSTFAFAQCSVLASSGLTYPVSILSKRLAMQGGRPEEERLYRGAMDCMKKIWRDEGSRGFYRGFGFSCFCSVGGAFFLLFYDRAKVMLGSH
eukprot:TRINITY_DN51249_c0_g1_i1.p1 TRINITY_DN51249_c0_g1~~TRINITY_DN51249_c0_g1_i1.p1  ORF type:complete len:326 (+),score=34.77 TRINITY_DN51249_c0_g1_i1:47-979(+)